jgi:DNA-binding IclR family transcriptional regulator
MDGRHTVGDLSEKTDADPHTVETFLETLRDARLVAG